MAWHDLQQNRTENAFLFVRRCLRCGYEAVASGVRERKGAVQRIVHAQPEVPELPGDFHHVGIV